MFLTIKSSEAWMHVFYPVNRPACTLALKFSFVFFPFSHSKQSAWISNHPNHVYKYHHAQIRHGDITCFRLSAISTQPMDANQGHQNLDVSRTPYKLWKASNKNNSSIICCQDPWLNMVLACFSIDQFPTLLWTLEGSIHAGYWTCHTIPHFRLAERTWCIYF